MTTWLWCFAHKSKPLNDSDYLSLKYVMNGVYHWQRLIKHKTGLSSFCWGLGYVQMCRWMPDWRLRVICMQLWIEATILMAEWSNLHHIFQQHWNNWKLIIILSENIAWHEEFVQEIVLPLKTFWHCKVAVLVYPLKQTALRIKYFRVQGINFYLIGVAVVLQANSIQIPKRF